MKRETLLILAIVFLVLLNLGTLGFLFSKRYIGGRGPRKPDKLIIEGLKLNDAQKSQFELLKKEHRTQINEIEKGEKAYHKAYFDLLKSASTDSLTIDSVIRSISNAKYDKDLATYKHFQKIRLMCEPPQQILFDSLVDEMGKILMHVPANKKRRE
jgi:Spy/CpxP family protein refolding chaperone